MMARQHAFRPLPFAWFLTRARLPGAKTLCTMTVTTCRLVPTCFRSASL